MDILSTKINQHTDSAVFNSFISVLRRLRAPDGCPWDRGQTLRSLRRYLIEESFEAVSAVDDGDLVAVAEELGDVFLVASLMALVLEEQESISLESVFEHTREKLIRRHPHVFGDTVVDGSDEVVRNWERIKGEIEGRSSSISAAGKGMPPLLRALEVQKTAAKGGFDWPSIEPIIAKIREEIVELEAVLESESVDPARLEAEVGDLLFSVVNVARAVKVDPGIAVHGTTQRFLRRFAYVEGQLELSGRTTADASLQEMDDLWDEAKRLEAGHD